MIDSGSLDGTREYFLKNYPKWKLISGNGNWWWTRAMYEGTKYVLEKGNNTDLILAMNDDCYFGPEYISQLIKTHKKYPDSLIGSLCVKHNKPTEVVESGIRIHWPTGLVYGVADKVSNKLSYYRNMKIIEDLDALPGKGTLIPLKVIKEIGHFNYKRLPHYIADYEFANRAKRAGYSLLVDPKAVVKHYWDATGINSSNYESKKSYVRAWNLLFGRKSMNNIIDWVNFLLLACPPKYLRVNLFITFQKLVKSLFSVYPFYYLRPQARWLLNKYLIMIDLCKKMYKKIFS